jgi:hypothetical protein
MNATMKARAGSHRTRASNSARIVSQRLALVALGLATASCGTLRSMVPATLGEEASGYGYVPLDGLAVRPTLDDETCRPWRPSTRNTEKGISAEDVEGGFDPYLPLLESLPDISVRFAVASFDASGGLAFGPAKVTVAGQNYRAILDYVNVDAIPVSFRIRVTKNGTDITLSQAGADKDKNTLSYIVRLDREASATGVASRTSTERGGGGELVTIPVYVGIGMRLSADIRALKGEVPLISLGAIGLEAQAKRLTGTLTVQTIGISGESVATSLPLPSALDQTTIENGILSVGSNRAVVYRTSSAGNGSAGSTVTTPRIVGLYSPIKAEPAFINAIYSELSRERPNWPRPCKPKTKAPPA